jgi:hypothetical protein
LEKVEPGTDDLIIAIANIPLVLIIGAVDKILNPVDIQKCIFPRVDYKNKCLEQTDKEQPIENILFGINFNDGRFLDC